MKILVTGGCGFIGANLCNFLVKKNIQVICLDNLSGGYTKNLVKKKNLTFIKGSCLNDETLKKVFNLKPNIVIHLAAEIGFNYISVKNPEKDLKTNTISTLKLLEYSKKFNIKKFIYSSSSCVYGNILNDASEGSKIKLDTPYAISKFTSENYCNFYRDYHKLNIIILRLFNTFGPLERIKKDSNVICRFFHNAIKNEDLNITGINSSRSFLFIDDLIDGFEIIINDKCFDNQTINIGSKEHTKIKKLAEKIINLTNSKSKIIISEPRKWDTVINRSAKIDKIYKLSNWSQKHSLDQGLKLYYEWLKKNDPKTINY